MSLAHSSAACVVAALATLVGSAPALGQDLTAAKHAFLAVLERYASGDYDGAAWAALSAGTEQAENVAAGVIEDVEHEMLRLSRLGDGAGLGAQVRSEVDRLRGRRVRLLKLSLLLHTEAAVKALNAGQLAQQLAISSGVISRLRGLEEDFRVNGPLSDHDDLPGGTLAQRPALTPSDRARLGRPEWEAIELLIRDWYLVVASHLQSAAYTEELDTHLRDGLELFKNDAEFLLMRGTQSEARAHASIIDRSLAGDLYLAEYIQKWRGQLARSRGDYDDALETRPDLHEATLRRGRVSAQMGDRKAAKKAYEAVAASDAQAPLRYLAWLFMGELGEHERQLGAAGNAYAQALQLMPRAQAPMLALSRMCDAAGDAACARKWLDRALAAKGPDRTDPWWEYLRGQAWLRDQRLASLRARGLRP